MMPLRSLTLATVMEHIVGDSVLVVVVMVIMILVKSINRISH